MANLYSYSRAEKLKGRKAAELVFKKGSSFLVFPVKVFFIPELPNQSAILNAGVGTGSRNFKKAVDRNRIKRLLRETFRMEKHILQNHLIEQNKQMGIFLLYIGKELPDLNFLKKKMPIIVQKLIKYSNEKAT